MINIEGLYGIINKTSDEKLISCIEERIFIHYKKCLRYVITLIDIRKQLLLRKKVIKSAFKNSHNLKIKMMALFPTLFFIMRKILKLKGF
jgi:hypothetical protein